MRDGRGSARRPGDAEVVEFCRRIYPLLVGGMTLHCRDRGVAEEFAQETLVRVWERWPTVRLASSPEAWTWRVALNLTTSRFRRRVAEQRAYSRLSQRSARPETGPDQADRLAVRAAVAALPERQRAALVLRYYADLPVAEVTAVATATDPDGDDRRRPGTETTEMSDATELARLLAERGWLAAAGPEWPVQPSDFVDGTPEEGMIVIGTLAEVRPGPVTTSHCLDVPDCVAQTNVETVLRVDLVLPGDQAHPDELIVPWVTEQFSATDGDADQATSDRLAAPFADAAPIGARVLVFLRPDQGGPYEWRPVEPSGIVIEDAGGVAIPQADPDAPGPGWTFDDYVAELDRLLTEQWWA